jgi:hypothetical protein
MTGSLVRAIFLLEHLKKLHMFSDGSRQTCLKMSSILVLTSAAFNVS